MILSDKSIESKIRARQIEIVPFDQTRLGSNSYDLGLSRHLAVYHPAGATVHSDPSVTVDRFRDFWKIETKAHLDAAQENPLYEFDIPVEGFILKPGILYLGSTLEKTTCCTDLVPNIEGKSSIGRLGMSVHITAGFGDAGFDGHWTLEITVEHPLKIYPGMPVAQIWWLLTDQVVLRPYNRKKGAKYANQGPRPVGSQMFRNFPLPE